MKKLVAAFAVVSFVAGVALAQGGKDAAAPAAAPAAKSTLSGTYTFGGSTTVAPIAYKALEAFQKDNPDVKISYEGVGSSTGIKQMLAGVYSLAGSSREFKSSEIDSGAKPVEIALDGLSVVVNKDVPVNNLPIADLAKIFAGDITNWKDVGGPDAPIVVINRDETSGTYGAFWELVCEKPYGKEVKYTKNAIVAKENGEVAAKVASTPHSIGYIGMAFVEQVKSAGGKDLMVDGVAPSVENVINKTYKISRYLYLATKGEPTGVEKAFIDYILSPKGQALVKSVDYIPLPKK